MNSHRSVLLAVLLVAAAPPAPRGQVVVDFAPAGAEPAWFVAALEELVGREFARFNQVQLGDKLDAKACPHRESHCLVEHYRQAGAQVIVLGTLRGATLEYETYDSLTRTRAFEGRLHTTGSTSATLQRHIGEIVRPVVHRGGLIDQIPSAATTLPSGGAGQGEHRFPLVTVVVIALMFLAVAPILFLWLLLGRNIDRGRLPASWPISGTLVVALAFALLTYYTPGLRALFEGPEVGVMLPVVGGILWGLYLMVNLGVVFAPMHGLERVKHDALFSLLRPWLALTGLRATILLVQLPALSSALVVCRALEWSQRTTVLIVLPAAGLFAWLWWLLLCDNLATFLDARLVDGVANARNPWHPTIKKYFLGYVRRLGVEVDRRLIDRVLFLPSTLSRVTSYGGGLGRPRILVGVDSREAALGELPDETEAPERSINQEEFACGMLVPRPPISDRRERKLDGRRRALTFAPPRARSAAPRLLGEQPTLLGWVMPHAQGIPLIANTRDDYDLVRQLLTEHYAAFRNVDDDDWDDTDPSQLDFLFGALLRELGAFERRDGALNTLRHAFALAEPKASWLGRKIIGGLSAFFQRFLAGPAEIVGDAYAALNGGLHHLIQYLYTLREERLLPLLTARADEPRLIMNSKEIIDELDDEKSPLERGTRRRLLWLSQLVHASLAVAPRRRMRWIGSLAFALVGCFMLVQAVRAAIHYHPSYVQRMNKGAASDERIQTR